MKIIKTLFRRLYYYKSFRKFKSYGKNLIFSKKGVFIRPEEIIFGNNVFISTNFHISARNLAFGDNIMIGPNLVIECDNHVFNLVGKTLWSVKEDRNIGSVILENDLWIGANVVILPNVVISEGCIIGAGSIVTKNMPPYTICVGNPCKPLKTRFTLEQMEKHLSLVKSKYSITEITDYWNTYKLL